ncbi:MAG TPA: GntR family transcriptional regulator [Candidatus Handelsmanbacteria bacterium]|nr:GntR family transcriptional regulator [Candidatus Handelsmanbacteria bacterium]
MNDGQEGTMRVLLKDQAYEKLKKLILEEVFAPGVFLSERQLAARLDMSKTPLRSALERLETEGFVAVSPQQGIVVREPSLREIVDLFDIRIALEAFVVQSIAGRLNSEQVSRLQANLQPQAKAAKAENMVECTRLDADFHLLLCEFLDNREILQVMRGVRDKLYRVVLGLVRADRGRLMISYGEHEAIVEAVVKGQGEEAARRSQEHLEYGKKFLVTR